MPTNTTNQQITIPIGTDGADNPQAFIDTIADVENRLVQRYTNLADRSARNPAPTLNELSILDTSTWYDRWTGAKWMPVTAIRARQLANQSVLNSVALVNSASLFVPLPVANTNYMFQALIIYDGSTTGDINVNFTVPAGGGVRYGGSGLATGSATVTGDGNFASANAGLAYGAIGVGSLMAIGMYGRAETAATVGNLTFQFAQNALDAVNATTVMLGSWLSVEAIS